MSSMMSFCDQLAAFFEAHPAEWIDGMRLAKIAGAYAWRSRCADLRKRGMTIENRQRRIRGLLGSTDKNTYVVSEYRYVPPVREPQQVRLQEEERTRA